MERALVIVQDSENGRELVKLAGKIISGLDGTLLIVFPRSESSYEEELQRKARSGVQIESMEDALGVAERIADSVAKDALADHNVEYETRGFLGEIPEDLLRLAEDEGCDHVFVTGEARSPTGKALFGDTAQRILLNFDGPVTSLIR